MGKIFVNSSTGKVLVSRDSAENSKLCSTCCSLQPDCECDLIGQDAFCFGSSGTPLWLVVQFSNVKDCAGDPFPGLNDVPICLLQTGGDANIWLTNIVLGGSILAIQYYNDFNGGSRLLVHKALKGIFCDFVGGDKCAVSFTNKLFCASGGSFCGFFTGYEGKEGTAIIINLCD